MFWANTQWRSEITPGSGQELYVMLGIQPGSVRYKASTLTIALSPAQKYILLVDWFWLGMNLIWLSTLEAILVLGSDSGSR